MAGVEGQAGQAPHTGGPRGRVAQWGLGVWVWTIDYRLAGRRRSEEGCRGADGKTPGEELIFSQHRRPAPLSPGRDASSGAQGDVEDQREAPEQPKDVGPEASGGSRVSKT